MESNIYEEKFLEACDLASNDKHNEAICICKELINEENVINNPSFAIWPMGVIVASTAFILGDTFPEPGSIEYKELHKYLKKTIELYHKLNIDEQENYKSSTEGFENWEPMLILMEANKPLDELTKNKSKKGGCFIATAVYGSYSAPEVKVLRKFRDDILQKSIIGKKFIELYYFLSPSIAKFISNKSKMKMIIRNSILSPFVKFIEIKFSK